MKKTRDSKGITLIALVVTIIILLILAGVTIGFAVNGTGIFEKAKLATDEYNNKVDKESYELQNSIDVIDNHINGYRDTNAINNYTLDEQRIGTWVDGKPIYRKVYSGTTPANDTGTYISMNGFLSDVDRVTKLEGFCCWKIGWQNRLNDYSGGNDNYDRITYNPSTNQLYIKVMKTTDNYSVPMYITFEYTKTTD